MSVSLELKFEYPSLSGASAYVAVRMHTRDEDGAILITPECASLKELETNVAILKDDLDKILAEARKRFAKAEAAGIQDIFR